MIVIPIRDWYCPNCSRTEQTREARPHSRFHTCPGLRGLVAPLVEVGVAARVTAHEREDYVGRDLVQSDAAGRPVMSVVTERDGGTDVIVFAPTARVEVR